MPSPPPDDGVFRVSRLLLVDDHEVVRAGLTAALGQDPGIRIIGSVDNGADAVAMARRERPDVAIVDMRLPDMPGPRLCRRLRVAVPEISVIVLSTYLSDDAVREALEAGASAYVTKAAGLSELRQALAEARNKTAASAGVSQTVRRLRRLVKEREGGDLPDTPTPQQSRVLELLAAGLTYAEVAQRLVISESTVRFHVQRLKLKLGTSSRTELVVRAVRDGYISVPEHQGGR